MRSGMSHRAGKHTEGTPNTNLCDLLDIPDRLETEFELSEGGHVTGILWGSTQDGGLGRDASERPPCEHYGGYNKKTKAGCVTVGSSRARVERTGSDGEFGRRVGVSGFSGPPERDRVKCMQRREA